MSIDDEIPDPQYTELVPNADDNDLRAYANLGVNNDPDSMNPGDEEATDTLLYTDSLTAQHATDEIDNETDLDDLNLEELIGDEPAQETGNGSNPDTEINREISDLAEDEDAGGEPY